MPRIGELINGEIIKIVFKRNREIGAIVKLPKNETGFLPISECKKHEDEFVRKVSDVVNVGDKIELRVIKIDRRYNKITLSLFQVNDEVNKKIKFEKKMSKFLKSSGEIQSQLKKNTDRKQGTLKKNRPNKNNNND